MLSKIRTPYILYILLAFTYGLTQEVKSHSVMKLDSLSQSHQWLRLIHHEKTLLGGTQSSIDNRHFFNSKTGQINPLRELQETINQFNSNPVECLFPARYMFLKKHQMIKNQNKACSSLIETLLDKKIYSISIVYASGYFSNPASFFGHISFKLNQFVPTSDNNLRNEMLNYGAEISKEDNHLSLIYKGLFGGYQANFSKGDYFNQQFDYTVNELRDLYDYELNLSSDQIQSFILHQFELSQLKFQYYFLNENCAYHMVEFLESILTREQLSKNTLLSKWLPYSAPIDVIHNLKTLNSGKSKQLIPSKLTDFHRQYDQSSTTVQSLFLKNLSQVKPLNEPNFILLDTKNKTQLTELYLSYYAYRQSTIQRDSNITITRKHLLSNRIQLPVSELKPTREFKTIHLRPDELPQPSFIEFSFLDKNTLGLDFSPHSIDVMTPQSSKYLLNTHQFLVSEFRVNTNSWRKTRLHQFELFHLEKLNPSKTGAPKDGSMAWKLNMGLYPINDQCQNCLVPMIETGAGYTWAPTIGMKVFSLVEAGIQNPRQNLHPFYPQLRLGSLLHPTNYWSIYHQSYLRTNLNKKYSRILNHMTKVQVRPYKDGYLNVKYQFETTSIWKLSVGFHF